MTSNLVVALVARTSSTVHSAGAWKNGSVNVSVVQLDKLSMPTESPIVPVPPFVSDASISVTPSFWNESVQVWPFGQTDSWTRNTAEVTGAIPVSWTVATSWKYPAFAMRKGLRLLSPLTQYMATNHGSLSFLRTHLTDT